MNNFFCSKRNQDLLRLEYLRISARVSEETGEKERNGLSAHTPNRIRVRSVFKDRMAERKILSELPIILESLILLVESGLGILPAIHKLLEAGGEETKPNTARYYLRKVHDLSLRGLPLGLALEREAENCPFPALRHFFLHLDIGANVGGKLGNSLRSLAQHSHQEWKLSVEARVRKLENLVVFPVFGSVIGLILITAAVPLIPLLELKDKLDNAQAHQSSHGKNNHIEEFKQ